MLSTNFVKYQPTDVVFQETTDRLIATQQNTIVVIHPHEYTTQNVSLCVHKTSLLNSTLRQEIIKL
jgi:hypothetical protein